MRSFRVCGFAVFALAVLASSSGAQASGGATKVRVYEPSGKPLPADFFIIRDARGIEIAPSVESSNDMAFHDVGRKLSFEFTRKGLKRQGFDVMLEDAPIVYLSMLVDPKTGEVKYIHQKAQRPHAKQVGRVRPRPGAGLTSSTPVNDDCANAIPILDGVTAFSNIDATTDGAPDPNGQYDGQTYEDIWYLYTPSCNGTLTVSTCGTANYDTDLVLYDADTDNDGDHDLIDCTNITSGAALPLASNDDAGNCAGFTSVVAASVVANHQYMVRIGGFGPGDEGSGTVLLSCGGAPSNDICQAPRQLTCGAPLEVTNIAATSAFADPAFSCAFGGPLQGAGTLWFRFTASTTSAFVSTASSVGVSDTLLAVYDGDCTSPVELACDDDSGPGLLSQVCVDNLTIGHDYLVQVASYPGGDLGRITMDLECPGPCNVSCDECAAACPIACGSSMTVDNTNANTDPLDPAFSCRFGGPDQGVGTLWFSFLATGTSAKIDTNASLAPDTLLAVYDGSCGALTELACSDDDGVGLLSEVCVQGLTPGHTYFIQTASFDSFSTGAITVNVECPCGAGFPNDECSSAIALDPLPASVTVDISGATDDITSPCEQPTGGPFFNVWYKVAGTGNTLVATTCNAGTLVSDTKISVFCADCGAPVCVAGSDDDCPSGGPVFASTASWCSQLGANYFITVGTFSEFTTPGVVQLDVFDTGSSCSPTVQCFPQGACCLGGGVCVNTTAADCAQQGGTYQGDDTSCSTNLVNDGGFEAGPGSGAWSEFSTNFGTPICDGACGSGGGTGPRTGTFWVWFGGVFTFEEGSMEQNLTIPSGASTLDFFLEIPASSANGVDFMRVKIDGVTVFEVFENDPFYAGIGYDPVSIPVGAFADGGVHALRFESTITGAGPGGPALTNFFVDDVSLDVQTVDCQQCVTLDFDTQDDLATPIGNGQTLTTPPEFGALVNLSAAGANLGITAFDSTPGGPNSGTGDTDMLIGKGNILMLQDSANPAQSVPGSFDAPVDDPDGGDLIFDFTSASSPRSVALIDLDPEPNQGASVVLTDVNGKTRTYTVQPGWTGSYGSAPGWKKLDLTTLADQVGNAPGFRKAKASEVPGYDPDHVVRVVVHMTGFGALDDLEFCR